MRVGRGVRAADDRGAGSGGQRGGEALAAARPWGYCRENPAPWACGLWAAGAARRSGDVADIGRNAGEPWTGGWCPVRFSGQGRWWCQWCGRPQRPRTNPGGSAGCCRASRPERPCQTDILARHWSPEARIGAVVAVVAHDKVLGRPQPPRLVLGQAAIVLLDIRARSAAHHPRRRIPSRSNSTVSPGTPTTRLTKSWLGSRG